MAAPSRTDKMNRSSTAAGASTNGPRLRSACDTCHRLKVRCTGSLPCEGCANSGNVCFYSVANRLGRPKGAKNKRPAARTAASMATVPVEPSKTTSSAPTQSSTAGPDVSFLAAPIADVTASTAWPPTSQQPSQQPTPESQSPAAPAHRLPTALPAADDAAFLMSPKLADAVMTDSMEPRMLPWTAGLYDMPSFLHDSWGYPGGFNTMDKDFFNGVKLPKDDPCDLTAYPLNPCPSRTESEASTASDLTLVATIEGSPASPTGTAAHLHQTTSGPKSGLECACLQRHTELLCALKRSQLSRWSPGLDGVSSLPLNRVLHNTNEVLTACTLLTECRDCAYNDDPEVLLLPLMCLRAVLQQLQRVSWHTGGGVALSDDGAARTPEALAAELKLAMGEETQMLVGDFEVSGSDKFMMLHTLRAITLQKAEAMLMILRDIAYRKKTMQTSLHALPAPHPAAGGGVMMDYRHDATNLAHVEQMLESLVHFVKVLHASPSHGDVPATFDL